MSKDELDPIREAIFIDLSLDELEERLEMQQVPVGAAALWGCTPVDTCDIECGGGQLCEFDCDCYGKCECLGTHCPDDCPSHCISYCAHWD